MLTFQIFQLKPTKSIFIFPQKNLLASLNFGRFSCTSVWCWLLSYLLLCNFLSLLSSCRLMSSCIFLMIQRLCAFKMASVLRCSCSRVMRGVKQNSAVTWCSILEAKVVMCGFSASGSCWGMMCHCALKQVKMQSFKVWKLQSAVFFCFCFTVLIKDVLS